MMVTPGGHCAGNKEATYFYEQVPAEYDSLKL